MVGRIAITMFYMVGRIAITMLLLLPGFGVCAQQGVEGPDFQPFPIERVRQLSRVKNLPLRTDNSVHPYFPPVVDQLGWSCNQASSIGYQLTYELNRKRDVDAEFPENQLSPAFTYNILMSESPTTGVSYFDTWEIVKVHGCANVIDFPYTNDHKVWMNGYDKYIRAMANKVTNNYSMQVSTPAELKNLKAFLFSRGDGFRYGGLATVQIASTGMFVNSLPADSYDAGASVITSFGTSVGHALTVVGYNDQVQYDFNHDGLYTNDVDITNDGVVDMEDWEVGALIVMNTWGKNWGDRGKAYLPYRFLSRYGYEGGIWNKSVHIIDVVHDYSPRLVGKVEMIHSHRSMVKVSIGCSNDPQSTFPEHIIDFPILNYHGGDGSLGLFGEGNHFEISLDISPLLEYVEPLKDTRFFLMINEKDPMDVGSGQVYHFSVTHFSSGDSLVAENNQTYTLLNNQATLIHVNQQLQFDKLSVADYAVQYVDPNQWLSIPLISKGSAGGNVWELVPDYYEDSLYRDFPEVEGEFMPFYGGQDGYIRLDLPFDFPFYGESVRTLYADEGGNLFMDKNYLDYPYSVDQDLVFRQRKTIVPMGMNLFFSVQGNGLYYSATDSLVRIFFDCQAQLGTQVRPYLFACNLYPDGLIEFHYSGMNLETVQRTSYRGGLSRGDGSQTFMTTPSTLGYVVPDQVVQVIPYRIPPKTTIESNSYLLTRPEEINKLYQIRVRITDKTARKAYGVIPVSTLDLSDPDIGVSVWPNPFSQSTRISFVSENEADVKVDVFDLNGRLVYALFEGELEKGQHVIEWNGQMSGGMQTPTGAYLVRIRMNDVIQHAKIIKNAW